MSKRKIEQAMALAAEAAEDPKKDKGQDEDDGEAAEKGYTDADEAIKAEAKAAAQAVARENFVKVSKQFMTGGCSRAEVDAAAAALEA